MDKHFLKTSSSSDLGEFSYSWLLVELLFYEGSSDNESNLQSTSHLSLFPSLHSTIVSNETCNDIDEGIENQNFLYDSSTFSRSSTMVRWYVSNNYCQTIVEFDWVLFEFMKLFDQTYFRQSEMENLNFRSSFSPQQQLSSGESYFSKDVV